ncbi:MAG: sugar nucleotide-binding protein [Bdellovibrionota bacterium]
MRVAIIGSRGMLGYAVSRYFVRQSADLIPISRQQFDIAADPFEKLLPIIEGADAVINCAGVIKPRIAAMTVEDVLKVNAIFPRNLAKHCSKEQTPCIHVTTDCVYSGKKGAYSENDFFDADDLYGMSKNAGESTECMVLRTSIIGEEAGQSRSLLEWARSQKGKAVNGFTNHHWNGLTTVALAEVVEKILNEKLYRPGLFHIHSPNTVDKFQLLTQISDAYDLELQITPTAAGVACDRSLSSIHSLSSEVATKTIAEQLAEMRGFFA